MGIEEIRRLITAHAHKEDLGLPGVRINKTTDPTQPTPAVAEPILAFSMQGAKRIALADSVYEQVPGTFMTVAVDLPITGHYVQASRTEPYLGFALQLRSSSIAELLVEAAASLPGVQAPPPPGISINPATPEMLDAIARLLALIERPADAPSSRPCLSARFCGACCPARPGQPFDGKGGVGADQVERALVQWGRLWH